MLLSGCLPSEETAQQFSAPQRPSEEAELVEELDDVEDMVREAGEAARSSVRISAQLANHYVERRLYGEALAVAEAALQRAPVDSELFYLAGLSSAYLAKAQFEEASREAFFDRAEFYYERTLEYDPKHQQALYAFVVFYLFERLQLEQAAELLERLKLLRSNDVDLQFLFARLHVLSGDIAQAVVSYEWIMRRDEASDAQRAQAEENIDSLRRPDERP